MTNGEERKYYECQRADTEYSAELQRLFGARAGDVRYTRRGQGNPETELRRLHDTYIIVNYGAETLARCYGRKVTR